MNKFLNVLLAPVDNFLNTTTMYRVVLYSLTALTILALIFNISGLLSYSTGDLVKSLIIVLAATSVSNLIFSKLFNVQSNIESNFITAFILFFLLYPGSTLQELLWIGFAGIIASASKYLFAINGKHIFNPVAIGAVIVNFLYPGIVVWWVGSYVLFIPNLIITFLIVRKIRRFELFYSTVVCSIITIIILGFVHNMSIMDIFLQQFMSWPILFFAAVMVTEPFTAPGRKKEQIIYGSFVGVLSSWPLNFGPVYMAPELVLSLANIYSFIIGSKRTFILKLISKKEIAANTYEFTFKDDNCLEPKYLPGQFMEFTLHHDNFDIRGIRRYFTLSSSPTENVLKVGVKLAKESSSFKKQLLDLKIGSTDVKASQLGGDFVLSKDPLEKLVFIAGGIGVTPFISMIKYTMDSNQKRDVTIFYATNTESDIAYKDFLEEAKQKIGLKVIYIISDKENKNWKGETGYITKDLLEKYLKGLDTYKFYISGPNMMVENYKNLLKSSKVPSRKIVTDYFPGFA